MDKKRPPCLLVFSAAYHGSTLCKNGAVTHSPRWWQ